MRTYLIIASDNYRCVEKKPKTNLFSVYQFFFCFVLFSKLHRCYFVILSGYSVFTFEEGPTTSRARSSSGWEESSQHSPCAGWPFFFSQGLSCRIITAGVHLRDPGGCCRRREALFAFHEAAVEIKKQTPTSLDSENTRRGVEGGAAPHLSNPSWPRRWVGITVKRPINETPIVRGGERAQRRERAAISPGFIIRK